MPTNFCHHCGKPAKSDWKACPYCETSFASLNERPKQHLPPQQHKNNDEPTFAVVGHEDDSDTNYLDRVSHYKPSIDALQIEIQKPNFQKETFGTLATSPFVQVIDSPRTPPPQLSQEEFFKQFQNEAGGPAKRIEIN